MAAVSDNLEALPKLQFDGVLHPARDVGPQGELKWLPLKQLFIDSSYQRQVLDAGRRNIRKIVEEFSWALFGVLVVARRGLTRYAIIDGQHRALGAVYRGDIADVPCLILQGGAASEALAFAAINGNVTRVHALQAFRARVVAQDADALAIVRLAAAANVKIAAYPKGEQFIDAGETMSLVTIQTGVRKYGDELVIAAMRLLRALDPEAALGRVPLDGAMLCLVRHREWIARAEEVGRNVGQFATMPDLLDATRQRKVSYGGTLWANFEALLTAKIEAATRQSGRFYSQADARRAGGGRA